MHALVTYLVKGSAYVLANEFVAFITFYVRKINVCLKKSYYSSLFSHLNTSECGVHNGVKILIIKYFYFYSSHVICVHIFWEGQHTTKSPPWLDFVKILWPIHHLWNLQLFVKCLLDERMENWKMSIVKTKNISIKLLL